MNKQVCNLISNINNGQLVNKNFIIQLKQKNCENILNVLWDKGFILGYKILKSKPQKIKIFLKYHKGNSVINSIKILSKPSIRKYYSVKQLWKLKTGEGIVILSTNKGFMSDNECKENNIGGEPFFLIK